MRYAAYIAAVLLTLLSAALVLAGHREWTWVLVLAGALAVLGTWDLLQRRSTLRRNYPLLAHFRYGLESIGPEIRQY
ncbi:MAG TPA: FMN-binding glutamate synthase family protein, partial [Luteimonas sp.]